MKILSLIFACLFSLNLNASSLEVKNVSESVTAQDWGSYNFGTVWVNSRNLARFVVTNTGVMPISYRDAYIYGADFRAAHSCRGTLLPSQKCFFEIEYWPMFEGSSSGRFVLNFIENDRIVLDLWGHAVR